MSNHKFLQCHQSGPLDSPAKQTHVIFSVSLHCCAAFPLFTLQVEALDAAIAVPHGYSCSTVEDLLVAFR